MIHGYVNASREAVVELGLVGDDGTTHPIQVVVDTGFSGHLTLPRSVAASLELGWLGRDQGTLADGSTMLFDVYSSTLDWNGLRMDVEVHATESQPMMGMSLLDGNSLHIEVVIGGSVTISPHPA